MTNPITETARGVIYVLGIIVSALATLAGPAGDLLSWTGQQTAFALSASGVVGLLCSTLARANLTEPTTETTPTMARHLYNTANTTPANSEATTTETTTESPLDNFTDPEIALKEMSNVEPDPADDPVGMIEEFAPLNQESETE